LVYANPLTAPLWRTVGDSILVRAEVCVYHSRLSTAGALHWEQFDVQVGGFFFLTLGYTWGVFNVFANTFRLFLYWSATPCASKFTIFGTFSVHHMLVFVLSPSSSNSFVQLHIYISLTDHW